MPHRRFRVGFLALLLFAAALPVHADPVERATATFTSAAHGFTLVLPEGWRPVPRRGADDLADVRFRCDRLGVSGFYQVYEGAVTDRPQAWYANARARYASVAHALPRVQRITFSDLETTSMGGAPAWTFGFVTALTTGPAVATRVVFAPRSAAGRVDIHEVVLTAEAPAMSAADASIRALLDAVHYPQ